MTWRARAACALALLVAAWPSTARAADPFAIRGIKGLWWEGIEKYRLALPWLQRHGMNFLMLCYSSFPASGAKWRSDYTPAEQRQIADLAREADRRGVRLCLSFNPGIWSDPPLVYGSERDYALILRKVRAVHALGVRWFALCLDDIGRQPTPEDAARFGTVEAAQAHLVNRLWADMRRLSPRPRLLFCPSAYTTEDMRAHMGYTRAIGTGVDREVMLFWTGPTVCSASITAADADLVAGWLGRKPFVWDNYPVNDMFPWRPLLAPLKNRSADLAGHVAGILWNPMRQWHASTLPLAIAAAYARAPGAYDPLRALEAAVAEWPTADRPAVRALLALYGTRFLGEKGYPPQPAARGREEAARELGRWKWVRSLLAGRPSLAPLWADVRDTLEADIRLLERRSADRLTRSPLRALGDEMEGGAGDLYGYRKYGRDVNYIYAASTGRHRLTCDFVLSGVPEGGAALRLTARNDDFGNRPRLRIALNGHVLFEGPSPYDSKGFATRSFHAPASALRSGENRLEIECVEPAGPLGMPPWWMVAEAELAPLTP